jgi:hypothetical protein
MSKELSEKQKKRIALSELSRKAEALKKQKQEDAGTITEQLFWASRTVNYMLLKYMYDTEGAEEFKTLVQWRKAGYKVKKGSKSFTIWAQPREGRYKDQKEKEEEKDDEHKYEFFPICHLFSNLQVEPIKNDKE